MGAPSPRLRVAPELAESSASACPRSTAPGVDACFVSPDEVGGPRINVYFGTRSHLVDTLTELA
ncbi:hypothetical protein [Amycolatopsis sp. Poz14]|uniref:hypothetical protein n=1 Tax=Amycolatopsis sp. Poz14 TaxID=1447705 RepID=UPI000A531395|nr:hypothetical protein [Amycolatopsis sp. Poz14]MCG3757768.1 hypothetical protein [Amycolatopsis sp. Poz14]